ncbi:MAG: hypothetical protein IT320_03895 [Anaerolineae bacterium]|nr:hypothetical protein [Anaerolineae bacterium]
MRPWTKVALVALIVAVALVAAGAFSAFAQDDDTTPGFPFGMMGRGFGHGMMSGAWDGDTMWTDVAEALGLDVETLSAELQAGKTLAEIAEAQGVDLQTVYDSALATATAHMEAMVTAGVITQEEADEHLSWMSENIDQMPMFSGAGAGNCPMGGGFGMMGGPGNGMMGRGMHGGAGWGPRGGGPRSG